jgi:hypothetical protein
MNSDAQAPLAQDHRDRSKWRRLLGNSALTAMVVLMCLGVMELATRWLLSDIGTTGDQTSYLSRNWAEQNPPITNHLGFREREFAARAAPGIVRIAAVGDSFTYGAGIMEPERVSDRIESALNKHDPGRFEVLNFGVPGANFEEHAANLEIAIREARPHFVLLQWYLNDLDDPAERRPRPKQLGWKVHHELSGVSALYGLAAQLFADVQVRLGLVPADAYYARFNDARDPIARRADRRFGSIIAIARQAGIPIAVYAWPELTRPIGTSPNDVLIDRLLATCRAEAIHCVDLRPVLARERDHQKLIVNRFDTHGSAYANNLAARELVHRLGPVWSEWRAVLETETEDRK